MIPVVFGLLVLLAAWRLWAARCKRNEGRIDKLGPADSAGRQEDWAQHLSPKRLDGSRYRAGLVRAMRRVDDRLGPQPFSAGTYELCLRLAFLYPILSVLGVWVGWGANTSGVPGLLPEAGADDQRVAERLSLLVLLPVMVFALVKGLTQTGWRSLAWLAFAVAGAGTVAGAVAGAVAGGVEAISQQTSRHFGVPRGHMVTWSLLVAVTIGSAVAAGRWGESNPVTGSMLVFLAALPLVNAVLDWGSVGVTRLLLRRAALTRSKAQRVALGLLDAAIALGVLAGLTVAMVGAVRGLNTVHVLAGGSADLVDLADVLGHVVAGLFA